MQPEEDNFYPLKWLADTLLMESRFEDAASIYERALQSSDGSEADRLSASDSLASCFRMSGRYYEAMERYTELYTVTRDRQEHQTVAYNALFLKINTLHKIHHAQNSNTQENLHHRLALVEEGLRWLQDIGQEHWRSPLLSEKGITLWELGQRQEGLDVMEEAYRVRKEHNGPGYRFADYSYDVARHARMLGQPDRALRVLDEAEGHDENSLLSRIRLSGERVKALLVCRPSRIGEALTVARRMKRFADGLQGNRLQVIAYDAWGQAAVAASSLAEAGEAYRTVWDTALQDTTFARPSSLSEAQKAVRDGSLLLQEVKVTTAEELRSQLRVWEQELSTALDETRRNTKVGVVGTY